MSIARATTQLIKSLSITSRKIAAIEEEKAEYIAAVNLRYASKEAELNKSADSVKNALAALGNTPEQIASLIEHYKEQPSAGEPDADEDEDEIVDEPAGEPEESINAYPLNAQPD